MSLGGPLPRAQSPRVGRVLSRGKHCRATEPPMASRPIRVTPATAAPAVPSTIHFRALRLRRARRVQRKSLGRPLLCSDAYELTPPRARLFGPMARRSHSSHSRDTFDRATPRVGLCAHEQDDFGPPPRRISTSCRSRRRLILSLMSAAAIPRRSMCDGAASGSLEATRLRRVLHCVPALARSKLRLGASVAARRNSAHAGGGIGLRRDTRKD
jgi:hypothetical protein